MTDKQLEDRLVGIRYGHWLSGEVEDATGWKLIGIIVHDGIAWTGRSPDTRTADAVALAEYWATLGHDATYQQIVATTTPIRPINA